MKVRRALISVSDKAGLEELARGLADMGVELLSSGGTANAIMGWGIPVTPVDEFTGQPEILGGRVKTLHPKVHGGILAREGVEQDLRDMEGSGIRPIDLVCVNLYPFESAVARLDTSWEEAIEKIDIGGPALLRAAAKNHAFVVPVCRPEDYAVVLEELRQTGEGSDETRVKLGARAFALTASYDAAVAAWMNPEQHFPDTVVPVFDRSVAVAWNGSPDCNATIPFNSHPRTIHLAGPERLWPKIPSLSP